MKCLLKANACSVSSNLGGGLHGLLALVLSPAQFDLISDVPFVRPVHPGPLVIPAGTTAAMSTILRDQHAEALRQFREVQSVEKALIKQTVAAIDETYFAVTRSCFQPFDESLQQVW